MMKMKYLKDAVALTLVCAILDFGGAVTLVVPLHASTGRAPQSQAAQPKSKSRKK